jgi:hypothetical protein
MNFRNNKYGFRGYRMYSGKFAIGTLFTEREQPSGIFPPPLVNYLLADSGDFLITDGGDRYIVDE